MRITVDGEPIDDPGRSSADIQRCTDVALDKADIQFQFDNLESRPRLSVAAIAEPPSKSVDAGDEASSRRLRCASGMYANYGALHRRAPRCASSRRSSRCRPRRSQVLEVDRAGFAEWQPTLEPFAGPVRELRYVLRAYDAKGNFDETGPQSLWVVPPQAGRD